jgi:NADP-dependent 3-hydroxy acid dehydrogenase YdfG
MNLKQKNGVALITGASTGIGATRADGLAQERRGTTILQSVLAALNEGKISEAVDQLDERSHSPTMRSTSSLRTRGA